MATPVTERTGTGQPPTRTPGPPAPWPGAPAPAPPPERSVGVWPRRLADIIKLLKVSPSAKPHVRIESSLDPHLPTSRFRMASALSEDSAPSASLDHLKAQAAPTRAGAPPEQLGSLRWPQPPAPGRPKVEEELPLAPSRPILRGDLSKLMRAVLNLLTNALKFTDTGVVLLSAHLVRSEGGVATVRLEVSDTGAPSA